MGGFLHRPLRQHVQTYLAVATDDPGRNCQHGQSAWRSGCFDDPVVEMAQRQDQSPQRMKPGSAAQCPTSFRLVEASGLGRLMKTATSWEFVGQSRRRAEWRMKT